MNTLHLRTGSRLHFGLMELAAEEPLRYAGLGLMLDQPGFELSFTSLGCSTDTSSTIDSPTANPRAGSRATASSLTVDASEAKLVDESSRSDSADLKLEYERRMAAVVKQHRALASASTAAPPTPACHIRLISALPMHSGLGAGTQLACAVAAGLELFTRGGPSRNLAGTLQARVSTAGPATADGGSAQASLSSVAEDWRSMLSARPPISTRWLAQAADRGLRSAIGLFGFMHGGLILDEGYTVSAAPAPNARRAAHRNVRPLAAQNTSIAPEWRVVLIVPQHCQAVSGAKEAEWMAELGSLPNLHRNDMLALAQEAFNLAPHGDRFVDFTHCLDQYMELAGQLFSRYQGGLYNGEDVATAVECARRIGLRGVGQSSWGPTVFGFAKSQAVAQHYAAQLTDLRPDWCMQVATPARHAAEYRWQ